MSIMKKLYNFFTEEEVEDEEIKELKQELIEESKKYSETSKKSLELEEFETEIKEPVSKQVLFVDEVFERKEKRVDNTEDKKSVKYNDLGERKFKASSYISPVHGLIKGAEEVPQFEHESKTKSERDYVKIRKKAFGIELEDRDEDPVDDAIEDTDFKLFKTSEIVDIKKRLQVDDAEPMAKDFTLDEAYNAKTDIDSKLLNSNKHEAIDEDKPGYLFDLLDELEEGSDE